MYRRGYMLLEMRKAFESTKGRGAWGMGSRRASRYGRAHGGGMKDAVDDGMYEIDEKRGFAEPTCRFGIGARMRMERDIERENWTKRDDDIERSSRRGRQRRGLQGLLFAGEWRQTGVGDTRRR